MSAPPSAVRGVSLRALATRAAGALARLAARLLTDAGPARWP